MCKAYWHYIIKLNIKTADQTVLIYLVKLLKEIFLYFTFGRQLINNVGTDQIAVN